MSDPVQNPGEHRPGAPPPLDRAPGERYGRRAGGRGDAGTGPGPAAEVTRGWAAASLAATAGALLFFALGLVDLGAGLIAPAAALGWIVAIALEWGGGRASPRDRGSRIAVAACLGAAAVAVGFLLNWAWARGEGGVLDPISYVDQRWGPLALVDVVAAAVAGALRAR